MYPGVRKVRGRAVEVRAPDGRTAELPRVGAQTSPSVSVAPGVFDMNFFGRDSLSWFNGSAKTTAMKACALRS